ncbi:hypothetical protein NQ318_002597 [Aromia moschata]|uniref:Cytochrome P450 n=1 Tax=Aromia moschata TaxID=1265417 RepID=A0AAV8XXF8_9CUCU|nr:hypothetical protein NQ318_002597 [Aromia moschata]
MDNYPYKTAMGVSINAQTNCDSDYVFAVKEMCRITFERSLSPIKMFDLLYPLCIDFYRERRYLKTLHDYTDSVIRSRRQELAKGNKQIENDEQVGSKKKMAFLDLLLNTTMDGKPLSDDFIREEVDTFMFEGHDTTSSAISFALYCLAQHPVIQERAFEEQKILFAKDRSKPVTYRDIQEMKYLDLVIKEVLRLYPSVPLIGRAADKDIEFKDGHVIPKDVSIFIFVYGANRDPKYFSEPEKFDPTRFENADGSYPYSYIPFSAGSRNCIGQKFAMLEVKSAISKVLRNYELLPATPKHEPVLLPQAVLSSANGIRIKIRRRKWDFLFMDN